MANDTENIKIDFDFFEYVIAYNATKNDVYTASILDDIDLDNLKNKDVAKYLKIIIDFYKKRGRTPNATEIRTYLVDDDLKNAYKSVLTKFSQMESDYDFNELVSHTEKYLKEKAVYTAVLDTVNGYSKENTIIDPKKILDRFTKACNISLVDNLGFDYFNKIDEHIEELNSQEKYISSGYVWLDKMLGGGFVERGRSLYIFSGPTNSGKSIVLGNIGVNILKQNKVVILISMEMSEYIYSKRISSQLSRIPIRELKTESNQLKNFLYDYRSSHPGSRLFVKEYPPHNVNPVAIHSYIKTLMMKERIKPDAIILDYLNLIEPITSTGSTYVDGKKVSEHVRALSYDFTCPIISAVQSNREAYDVANPTVKTTGESIGIPQTADAQIAIWSTDAEKELGMINMGMQKNRFGANFGKCSFKIDYDTLAIDETEAVFSDNDNMKDVNQTLTGLAALEGLDK
jgi:replicative DNA helicase